MSDDAEVPAEQAQNLMAQPLWLAQDEAGNFVQEHVPNALVNTFHAFQASTLAQETSFGLIADWYIAAQEGKTAFNKKADLAIAKMSPADWGDEDDERDCIAVMDRVAKLAGWGLGGDRLSMPDFILKSFKENPNKALSIDDFVQLFEEAGYTSTRDSIRGRLVDLADAKEIFRWEPGVYSLIKKEEIDPPPALPAQTFGTRFQLENNKIKVAKANPDGTDWNRVESLHPILLDLAEQAKALFGRDNCAHAKIGKLTQDYLAEINKEHTEIDFTKLTALGIRLANAEISANREIADRLKPEFEDEEHEALSSLLDLNGPFVLSTKDGQELLADTQSWKRRPEAEAEFKRNAILLADRLSEAPEISEPEVSVQIRNAGEEIGVGPHPERASSFGFAAIKNSLTVLVGTGALYVAGLGLKSGLLPIQAFSVYAVLFASETIKKTKWFKSMTDAASGKVDAFNDLNPEDIEAIRKQAGKKFYDFVLKNEKLLRDLAGDRREFDWVHKVIDWIKSSDVPPSS